MNTLSNSIRNDFWKDILNILYEFRMLLFRKNDNDNDSNFIYQEIWYNSNVKISQEVFRYRLWISKGIRSIYNLISDSGTIMSYQEFCEKYDFNPPFTLFYGLKNAILKKWPCLRTDSFEIVLPNYNEYIEIIIKNKEKQVSVYDIFLSSVHSKQEYIDKWCFDMNVDKDEVCRDYINILPFRITKDTKLFWFQYRLLHRIIPTNILLYKMRIKDTTLCSFCNADEETLLHLFYSCNIVQDFWKDFSELITRHTDVPLGLEKETIIFGKQYRKHNDCINLLLLLAKQFIFTQKIKNSSIDINSFMFSLKCYFDLERRIYAKNGKTLKFKDRWEMFNESDVLS